MARNAGFRWRLQRGASGPAHRKSELVNWRAFVAVQDEVAHENETKISAVS